MSYPPHVLSLAARAAGLLDDAAMHRRQGRTHERPAAPVLDILDQLEETAQGGPHRTRDATPIHGLLEMRQHVSLAMRHAEAHDEEAATILAAVATMLRRVCRLPEAGTIETIKQAHPLSLEAGYDFAAPPPGYWIERCYLGNEFVRWAGTRPGGVCAATGSHAEVHAALWVEHMSGHEPRGYTLGPAGLFMGVARARAVAWDDFLRRDAATLADLLALAEVWPGGMMADPALEAGRIAWILRWPLLDRGRALDWAAAVHVCASGDPEVTVPPRPACLDVDRPE